MCGCNQPKPCGCVEKPKGCKEKDISTDCVLYTGENLVCSGVQSNTILTDVLQQLDEFICNKFNDFSGFITLQNVGDGAKIYKGDDNQGRKLIRSIISGSENVVINENLDTISISVEDIFTENGTLDISSGVITFLRSDGSTYDVDISGITVDSTNTFTTSSAFNTNTGIATFSRNDGANYTLDLSSLQQVQANVLETNTASKAYIVNKNPVKTVNDTTQYTVQVGDNNYVIEINNGTNNITILIPAGLPTDNFFVGFIQKGTGTVTFSGYDIKPVDLAPTIYGQGHNAALEIIGGTKYVFGNLTAE